MRRRVFVLAVLAALAMPAVARANGGILLLAHNGSPEWNTQVQELATKVDAQKPAEIAFGVLYVYSIALEDLSACRL